MNKAETITLDAPGYDSLAVVLKRAFDQASSGKGRERHANELPFHEQPMQQIAKRRGVGFLLGQADKKSEEAMGLPPGRDVAELLGAIVYLAGAVIFLEQQRQPVKPMPYCGCGKQSDCGNSAGVQCRNLWSSRDLTPAGVVARMNERRHD